jgi:hypothetical protein
MNGRLTQLLGEAATTLREWRVPFALVGGLAIGIRAMARATRDVDLAVSVGDENLANDLVRRFHLRGWMDRPEGAVFQRRDTGGLALVRLVRELGSEKPCVDLIFSLAGIEREVVAGATPAEIAPGFVLPVSRIGHLIALKLLAGRSHDLGDLGALLEQSTEVDQNLAFESLALIEERNFHEGRNLRAELEAFINRSKRPDPWVLRS